MVMLEHNLDGLYSTLVLGYNLAESGYTKEKLLTINLNLIIKNT